MEKVKENIKKLSVDKVNLLIERSAGYMTDEQSDCLMYPSTYPLPENAKKITFRKLNDDKKTFSWTEWYYIKRNIN